MNYNKMTVKDVTLSGKKVLLRCDFNVPQDKTTGEITSDKRIVAALPTIRYLLDNGAAVIACSHLGKPKGTWKESLTLAPVAKRLSELLGMEVIFAKDIVGEDAKAKAAALQPGQLLLLENPRFDPREEKNDPEFAKELASMAELYVSDAFGTVHRAHASTAGVAAYLPAYAGLLIEKDTGRKGIFEAKTHQIHDNNDWKAWREGIGYEEYFIQVLHGLNVTGFDFVCLRAELKRSPIYKQVRTYIFDINDDGIRESAQIIFDGVKDFWENYIIPDVEPTVIKYL